MADNISEGTVMQIRTYGTSGPVVVVLHGGPGAPGYMAPVARGLADWFRGLFPAIKSISKPGRIGQTSLAVRSMPSGRCGSCRPGCETIGRPTVPKTKEIHIGKLPPKYTFILNPYAEYRFTRCPNCNQKMKQRKLPLFIHVDPLNPVVLNKTCRYCPDCDLLIAHQDEIEPLLVRLFAQLDPGIIGNDYLVVGTVERPAWRESMKQLKDIPEMLQHLHDFQGVQTVEVQPGGWYPAGLDPSELPIQSPVPLDTLWKKQPQPQATPKPQRTKRKGRRRGRK